MREGQIKQLLQAEELLESAKTNPHHFELAKYLVRNMNAIQFAIENGWTKNSCEDDLEYMKKYLDLRDTYGAVLYPESIKADKSYHPLYSDDVTIDAIKCGYDFKTECGELVKGMIQSNYGMLTNAYYTENYPKESAFAREVLKVLDENS